MEELIDRLKDKVGVTDEAARRSVEAVIVFLSHEAPADAMAELTAAIPGVAEMLAAGPARSPTRHSTGHFGGMARLMELANQMMAAGMTMAQVQAATREVVDFARERAGEEALARIVTAVPGLRQVV